MGDPAGSTSRGSKMVGHGILDLSAWTKVDPNMWADVYIYNCMNKLWHAKFNAWKDIPKMPKEHPKKNSTKLISSNND